MDSAIWKSAPGVRKMELYAQFQDSHKREILKISKFNKNELIGLFFNPIRCISCIYNVKYIAISQPKLQKKIPEASFFI